MKHRHLLTLFVALAAAQAANDWWTLAYETELKGRKASLTRTHFEQVVANFARYGRSVPVTLYHADLDAKAHPDARKAHAWIDEVRVGSMEIDGKTVASLEGRRRWVNDATRADMASGALVGGSVTIYFSWPDDVTGEDVGAVLYSFSLTNNPALTHLPALAASSAATLSAWWGELDTRADLLGMLRTVLGLPAMATEAETLAELDKLARYAAAPDTAVGIDLDEIFCHLRDALRLPALSTPDEVIAAVRAALTALPLATLARGPSAARTTPEKSMSKLIALAALIGVTATTDDEASVALDARLRENLNIRRSLGLAPDAPAADVAPVISKLTTEAARAGQLATELEGFKKREAAALATVREGWITDVMVAHKLPESVRPSLELHAAQDWEGFCKAHPRPSREELAQRGADPLRLGRIAKTGGAAPAPTTGDGADEPDAEDIDAAVQALMSEHGVGYAEALDMLGAGG